MAIWQYNFFVLPKGNVTVPYKTMNNEEEGFDDSFFWKSASVGCLSFDSISTILPRKQSWSDDLILYGDLESNCFTVLCEEGTVESVSFRIDLTKDYEALLRELLLFLNTKKLVVLDENLNEMPYSYESFRWIIENSPQKLKYKKLSNGEGL